MVTQFRTYKTTLGHKYRMRIAEDEKHERSLFRASVVILPFLASVAMTLVWLWR